METERSKDGREQHPAKPRQSSNPDQLSSGDKEIPAIRHVGPTLESDPEYNGLSHPGYSTPEAQIAAEASETDLDQRRLEEDDFDSLSGRTLENRPESLKTKLPGDTSSDPHSDVGPDKATTLQDREDLPNSGGVNRA